MKTINFILMSFLFSHSMAVSQIVINEIMFTPSDASNEWFEIYNTGNTPVNLHNWKWKDATSSQRTIITRDLFIGPGEYRVICQDSVKLKQQFLNTGSFIQTSWSQLNNSGDNLIIIDNTNIRIDSLTFSSSWGGTNGYSLERIDPGISGNVSSNWGSCISPEMGSPARQNSLTPKPHDLMLKSFQFSPLFPSKDKPLNFSFVIRNTGLNTAVNFKLSLFEDFNDDSISHVNELIVSQEFSTLNVKDSVKYEYTIQYVDTGSKQFIALVTYPEDNDSTNNKLIKRIYVSPNSGEGNGIVINEIMYDPVSNQTEWVEFYNSSGQIINVRGWMYKEISTSITLSDSDIFMRPGDYFILAHDSSIFQSFSYLRERQPNQLIKFSSELSLNNSGEYISVTDSNEIPVDELHYDPDWHNSEIEDPKGKSLERLSNSLGTSDRSNWSTSANLLGGTPGLINSIYLKNTSIESSASVDPNPFSPDSDGHEDFTLIKFKLEIPFGQMRVRVFDMKGRLVRTLANNEITGSEGTIIFDGMSDGNEKLRTGIYILVIEAVDSKAGTVHAVKAPVVVAGKL